ncbi:uncharacterized protein LOC143444876 isoform X2 [Clavelina lepadiformis]|uniref:uncharacterized protein LOC143444876 isoform X2 n=1 Tax=Clavelina lepadiformis TaxID=159417 RepID=UPI00404262F6
MKLSTLISTYSAVIQFFILAGESWDQWSACSAQCGIGVRRRSRSCGSGCRQYDDKICRNAQDCSCSCPCKDLTDNCLPLYCYNSAYKVFCAKTCGECPPCLCVGSIYSGWGPWTDCTVTCGGGRQYRYRDCNNIVGCIGSHKEERRCGQQPCFNQNVWSTWYDVGSCSAACGGGSLRQRRECSNGNSCQGDSRRQISCNTHSCNDGDGWSPCSVTCGIGVQTRTRSCGTGCTQFLSRECEKTQNCPCNCQCVDLRSSCGTTLCFASSYEQLCRKTCNTCSCNSCDEYGQWGRWTPCSKTCGGGIRHRYRSCGKTTGCAGSYQDNDVCATRQCSVQAAAEWSSWTNQGSCSRTCGGGRQKKVRRCLTGDNCDGRHMIRIQCNTHDCAVWGPWRNDGGCSRTCGGGRRRQRRTCQSKSRCVGSSIREIDCNTNRCDNSAWGSWRNEGGCSKTCGGGKRRQRRTCLHGSGCVGRTTREVNCNTNRCPSIAVWGPWRNEGSCSKTCGEGRRRQRRTCRNGSGCVGPTTREINCNNDRCQSNPVWGPWRNSGTCSRTCGGGKIVQIRTCQTGSNCVGLSRREVPCNTPVCRPRPSWSAWTSYSQCDVTCGSGTQYRTRSCRYGNNCPGNARQERSCNSPNLCQECECSPSSSCVDQWPDWCSQFVTPSLSDCLSNEGTIYTFCKKSCGACQQSCSCEQKDEPSGHWGRWGSWGSCSKTCGSGVQRRQRTCSASSCPGSGSMERACNRGSCGVSGGWGECSRSCGDGTQRYFSSSGQVTRFRDCNLASCPQAQCRSPFFVRYGKNSHRCCDASQLSNSACGVSAQEGRVVNGEDAIRKRWPWMVFLNLDPNRANAFCGGMLVSERYVITAAHCLILAGELRFDFRSIQALLGALNFEDRSSHVQVRGVRALHIHPSYQAIQYGYDIAILELSTPANLGGSHIKPICLPKGERVPDDAICVAAGWGRTTNAAGADQKSSILQEVQIRTLPFDVCAQGYGQTTLGGNLREKYMICAGKIAGGPDTCAGDSGGPLMCQRCSSCAWTLAGVTSFGPDSCGQEGLPGVYTRVSFYGSWIDGVVGERLASGDLPSCS